MAEKVTPEEGIAGMLPKNSTPKTLADIPPGEADFEIFGPEPEAKTLASGTTVHIKPFEVRQIKVMLPYLKNLSGPLTEMFATGELNITKLQELDGEALVNVVAIALDVEPEVVDRMSLAEFIWCATKIVTVNGDFFVRTLPRVLGGAAMAIIQLFEGSQGLRKPSSPTATPSETSSATP